MARWTMLLMTWVLLAGCAARPSPPSPAAPVPEDALVFRSCYELAVVGNAPAATAGAYVPEGFALVEAAPGLAVWVTAIYHCADVATPEGLAEKPAEAVAFLVVTPPAAFAVSDGANVLAYGLPLFVAATSPEARATYERWGLSPLEATEGGVGFADVEGVSAGGAWSIGPSHEVFARIDFNEESRPSPAGLIRLFVPDGELAPDAATRGWVDVAVAERTSIGDTVNTVEFTGFEGAAGAILPPRTPATGEIWRKEADVSPFRLTYTAAP